MVAGTSLPRVRRPIPAETGRRWIERLASTECPALTTRRKRRAERTGASHDPIVWVEAVGANVVDADGNLYVDLTSGFGVALIGHRHPEVIAAVKTQADMLIHALGDLQPSSVKIELLERLCELAPWPNARAMLSLSGADAVTAALKTAVIATGRPGVVAFEGGYHGLSYGPLSVSGYSERFRAPFAEQLGTHARFAHWPTGEDDVARALRSLPTDWSDIGAVIVEPIQARGGVRIPPPGFLAAVGERCHREGAVIIVDEIFTGLGRCGCLWRSVEEGLVPDLICVGKALGGGLPVSACLGRREVMQAWGDPAGEAIHTGTFYGDPLGSAAALATLDVVQRTGIVGRASERGDEIAGRLVHERFAGVSEVRHAGLMIGVQLEGEMRALTVARSLLEEGYLVLPAGANADVLQVVPPVSISDPQLDGFIGALHRSLERSP